MQKQIESILVEFDALWGGADANSHKQETWRKELAARIVRAVEHSVQRTANGLCSECGKELMSDGDCAYCN